MLNIEWLATLGKNGVLAIICPHGGPCEIKPSGCNAPCNCEDCAKQTFLELDWSFKEHVEKDAPLIGEFSNGSKIYLEDNLYKLIDAEGVLQLSFNVSKGLLQPIVDGYCGKYFCTFEGK